MSDSAKSVEIEDVLSSIRRLVSEHHAQRGARAPVAAPQGEGAPPPGDSAQSQQEAAPSTTRPSPADGIETPDVPLPRQTDSAAADDAVAPDRTGAEDDGAEDLARVSDAVEDAVDPGPDAAGDVEDRLVLTPSQRVAAPEDPWTTVRPAADAPVGDGQDWADALWSGTGRAPDEDEAAGEDTPLILSNPRPPEADADTVLRLTGRPGGVGPVLPPAPTVEADEPAGADPFDADATTPADMDQVGQSGALDADPAEPATGPVGSFHADPPDDGAIPADRDAAADGAAPGHDPVDEAGRAAPDLGGETAPAQDVDVAATPAGWRADAGPASDAASDPVAAPAEPGAALQTGSNELGRQADGTESGETARGPDDPQGADGPAWDEAQAAATDDGWVHADLADGTADHGADDEMTAEHPAEELDPDDAPISGPSGFAPHGEPASPSAGHGGSVDEAIGAVPGVVHTSATLATTADGQVQTDQEPDDLARAVAAAITAAAEDGADASARPDGDGAPAEPVQTAPNPTWEETDPDRTRPANDGTAADTAMAGDAEPWAETPGLGAQAGDDGPDGGAPALTDGASPGEPTVCEAPADDAAPLHEHSAPARPAPSADADGAAPIASPAGSDPDDTDAPIPLGPVAEDDPTGPKTGGPTAHAAGGADPETDPPDAVPEAAAQIWDGDLREDPAPSAEVTDLSHARQRRSGNLAGVVAAEQAQTADQAADDPSQDVGSTDETAGPTGEAGASDMDGSVDPPVAEAPDNDFSRFGEEDDLMDEDALRDLIVEVVREQLQGEMGERLTRNIRKLVRREIRLALAAEHFE